MFENITFDKYLIIALIIIIILLIYLFYKRTSSEIEGMKNINYSYLNQNYDNEIYPWGKISDIGTYRTVNHKNKLKDKYKNYIQDLPEPFNDRPDLSQCQPCICPQPSINTETEYKN